MGEYVMKAAKYLIPLLILSSQAYSAAPIESDFSRSQKEIKIMNNIIKASLNSEKGIKVRSLSGVYLAEQGYIFDINASGLSGSFKSWNDFFVDSEFDFVDGEMVIEAKEVTMDLANEAYQSAMEALRQSSEVIREFAEQEREIEYQLREVERERRDLDLERRHAARESEKEVQNALSKLEQKKEKLQVERKAVREKRESIKQSLQSKSKEKAKKAAEKRKENIRLVTNTLTQTLCDYGAGLKGLSKDQFVNFVIDNAMGNKQDLILIFKKSDISQCVMGDISSKQLLAKATHYNF